VRRQRRTRQDVGGAVQDDADGALVGVLHDEDDRAVEVRIDEHRGGDQEHALEGIHRLSVGASAAARDGRGGRAAAAGITGEAWSGWPWGSS
jgi:hypothetical protein